MVEVVVVVVVVVVTVAEEEIVIIFVVVILIIQISKEPPEMMIIKEKLHKIKIKKVMSINASDVGWLVLVPCLSYIKHLVDLYQASVKEKGKNV